MSAHHHLPYCWSLRKRFVWFWKWPCLRKRFVWFWKRPCPFLWHRGPGRSWDPFPRLASPQHPLLSLVSESIMDSLSSPSDEIRTKTKQKAMGCPSWGGGGGGSGGGGGGWLLTDTKALLTARRSSHAACRGSADWHNGPKRQDITHSHFGQFVLQSALTGMVSSSVYTFNRPTLSVPSLDVLSSPLPVSPASPCTVSKWSRS